MSHREGIKYSESSEDEDNKDSRSNDSPRGYYYSKTAEQAHKDRAHLVPLREAMRPKATAPSSVPRPPSTTASREPAGVRGSHSSNKGSVKEKRWIDPNMRTFISIEDIGRLNGIVVQRKGNYVSGLSRPGHSTSPKPQRQGLRALSNVCSKDTISKDSTVGNQVQMDDLLASFGKRVLGIHCQELQKIPDSSPELDLDSKWKPYGKNITRRDAFNENITDLSPSHPSRWPVWEKFKDRSYSNRKRRHRQRLARDEYGDEAEADLRDKGPPHIPIEPTGGDKVLLEYLQAVDRAKAREHAKAEGDLELDDDSSESRDGAEYEELSDYELKRPAIVRSRERFIPAARLSWFT